ncbi:LysM peptidoglycan-binding domain-containing protein [Paenibacillus lutimineralis]|uniref:LysM peptidoglycan-binding domain-containing protein n=1 Tax=Paenibacillus lutimineralis TaxID=2707005 RepID=A0A3Q9I8H5_9BACL|nr:LysM peptidoglycan-binding domain-containing protein [Paenibacillus lutimineralis]AZS14978.1 LysM peptidoglycan-binding domain-containing protein [Paenibacillus lutimineralis]
MLKYSTYKSIYTEPVQKTSILPGRRSAHLSRTAKRTMLVLVLLLLTCTGVVSAFASSTDNANKKPLETVIVMPGDTLWEIASEHKPQGKDIRKYIDTIKRANGKHLSSIQAGEVLVLPN